MANKAVRLAVMVLLAVGAFVAGVQLRTTSQKAASPAPDAVESLFKLELPDLKGQTQHFNQWRGRPLVVNFWATWCAPCREEIPLFVKLQERYRGAGLLFIGISIDQADKTSEFAANFRINYPVLIGTFDTMKMSQLFGNTKGVLPYTVIIDRNGRVISTEMGGLSMEKLEQRLKPLL